MIYQFDPCGAFSHPKDGIEAWKPWKKESVTKDGCSSLAQNYISHALQLTIIFRH